MRQQSRVRRSKRGFSLIEVLVVIVIIGILAAVLVPRLIGGAKDASGKRVAAPKERAQQVAGISYLQQINQALMMYKTDNDDRLPRSLSELKRYGVTDEMLIDPMTRQPLQYDPTTGQVWNPSTPARANNAANLPNQNPGQNPNAPGAVPGMGPGGGLPGMRNGIPGGMGGADVNATARENSGSDN